jgi:hypothetical protein
MADGGLERSERSMARKKQGAAVPRRDDSNRIKDPEEWTTGDEPMTGAQESYLHTLAAEAGEQVEPDLSKAEASKRIDELQDKRGRG